MFQMYNIVQVCYNFQPMQIFSNILRASLLTQLLTSAVAFSSEVMPQYELSPFVVVAPNVPGEDFFIQRSVSFAKPVDLAAILTSTLPGAALTRKGPLASDIVLRGLSRDNLIFTVNNNQTFPACPNRMDPPAFHVSSQQIESIHVRTGPFSVHQGASVGGVIAVETVPPTDQHFLTAYGYLGSFDYYSAGFTAGSPLGNAFSATAGIYYQRGKAYKDGAGLRFTELPGTNFQQQFLNRTAFEVITAEFKGSYAFGRDGRVIFNYAYQDANDVLYPGLLMDAPKDTMNRVSVAVSSSLDAGFADSFEATFAFSHVNHDMRDSLRTSLNNMAGAFVSRGYFMRTEAISANLSARVALRKQLKDHSLIRYGFDIIRRYWDANNVIGVNRNDMLPDTVSDLMGLFGVYEQRMEDWAYEIGVRVDYGLSKARDDISFVQSARATTTNRNSDILPSLYGLVSRSLNPFTTVYTGLGLASRIPDGQERYINLDRPMANPDWVGNPDLKPVATLEWQLGLQYKHGPLDARISAFHAWLYDYVYLARLSPVPALLPGGATSYENIDVRLYGVSADLGYNINDFLRLETGFAWQEGVKRSRPVNSTNDVLAEIPPLRARLAAIYSYGAFSVQAEGQIQAKLDRIDPDLGERLMDGWAVLNLTAGYQFNNHFGVSVGVDNLFDKTYAVGNSFVRDPFRAGVVVNEPGRFWFMRVGLRF